MSPLERARAVAAAHGLQAVALRSRASFAWVTGGGDATIERDVERGAATVVVTADAGSVVVSAIERDRFADEEPLGDLTLRTHPWHEPPHEVVAALAGGGPVGSDLPAPGEVDLGPDIAWQRSLLGAAEQERLRALCAEAADLVEDACRTAAPRDTERGLAARLAAAALERAIEPAVLLVGGAGRSRRHRHPVPTEAVLGARAMVVLCARRHGLVANVTRWVRFAADDEELVEADAAVSAVHARLLEATKPGRALADLLAEARAGYADAGHPDAWLDHHQGGVGGYAPRERVATPDAAEKLVAGQVCAWNPSLPGAKSEETVLVTDAGPEILTDTGRWPRRSAGGGWSLAEVLDRA
jgi:Xaa-Pro dipeptidase